jgi:hypothetical protein
MAASTSEIRAWARDNGYEMPDRGNISGDVRGAYDAAHPGSNGSGPAAGPDYPDDDFETAFADVPGDDDGFDESVMEEAKPRRPKAAAPRSGGRRPGAGRRSFFGRKPAAGKAAKKKAPRVSTEDVLGSLWRGAAKLAAPLPPLQRTLRIQAPVAGLILEDAVKGTAADMVLQPFARMAGQGKVISALVGPPVIVTALLLHVQQRQAMTPPQEPNALFVSVGTEALRSSLMTWMEVAGPKFEVAIRREREFEEKYGQSVDDLIAFLLAPPAVTPAEAEAEEEMIRRAQGIVTDA